MQKDFLRKGSAARFPPPQGSSVGGVTVKQIKIIGKGIRQRHEAIIELQQLPYSAGAG